jgi:hypothetical protein
VNQEAATSDRDRQAIAAICMAITGDEGHWGYVAIEILQGEEEIHQDDLDRIVDHLRYHPQCPDGEYLPQ